MANEVQKFDPSTLMDGVKDRIKATFASMIPDEAWDTMVKTTVDEFFKKDMNQNNNYYGNKLSRFDFLVLEALQEESKRKIAEYLKTEEFTTVWNGYGQPVISAKVKEMFIENSGQIFLGLLGNSFQMMMNDLETRLRNNNRY
jgi:hypothetical protein